MKKILLVEDDPFIKDIYETALEQAGYEVEMAEDGEQALQLVKEKPDLVLLDIVLPDISGWEVLKEIKSAPELEEVKVFVLSNLDQKEKLEKDDLEVDNYFIKANYKPSEVVEKIKREI